MGRYFAGRIKHARLKAGLSQGEMARHVGLVQPHISRLESGRQNATEKTLEKIARGLGISMAELCSELTPD